MGSMSNNNVILLIHQKYLNGYNKYLKWNDGEEYYFDDNGELHRTDGPAVILPKSGELYYYHGKICNSLEELIIENIIN